uniref:Uncharacterized protein n=1 Tax=Aegilops tauschii subsp. strangulata TaxID=200361 RepID=A0A453G982_AEGTS
CIALCLKHLQPGLLGTSELAVFPRPGPRDARGRRRDARGRRRVHARSHARDFVLFPEPSTIITLTASPSLIALSPLSPFFHYHTGGGIQRIGEQQGNHRPPSPASGTSPIALRQWRSRRRTRARRRCRQWRRARRWCRCWTRCRSRTRTWWWRSPTAASAGTMGTTMRVGQLTSAR